MKRYIENCNCDDRFTKNICDCKPGSEDDARIYKELLRTIRPFNMAERNASKDRSRANS